MKIKYHIIIYDFLHLGKTQNQMIENCFLLIASRNYDKTKKIFIYKLLIFLKQHFIFHFKF